MIEQRLSAASKIIGPSYAELAGILVARKVNPTLLKLIADNLMDAAEIIHDVARSLPQRPPEGEDHDQSQTTS